MSAGAMDSAPPRPSDTYASIENALSPACDSPSALPLERYFSTAGVHPFDQIEWETRTATITDDQGEVVFEQRDAEVPKAFSQLATKVVVSKYFYGELNTDEREQSFKQLVHRVTRTIADWGLQDGLFAGREQADLYYDELTWLCVNQCAAFNSPVWFNVGLYQVYGIAGSNHNHHWNAAAGRIEPCRNTYEYPQASACFIQSVSDTMEDIMALATSEAMLFKHGSGTGTDLSHLRSSREKLSGGGKPSGPISFMRVYDQIAAVVKSGGKTRRAAKMQSLKIHHPDIREFICCKMEEEKKAWSLIEQGYDGDFNGVAYGSVMFQNSNLSVRVTDEFMRAVENDDVFDTYSVTTGEKFDTHKAAELMDLIAEGTRICGDPGLQYDTTINRWHTCPAAGRINASNPCSEYMFLDDSACNLASLNLMKFRRPDGTFDVESFRRAVRILIIAQELLVDHGSYPTARIAENSHRFRALGLGYANLGSLIMSLGLPYDSRQGRALAAAITAIMTGTAYGVSAELSGHLGPFEGFAENRAAMLKVIDMHRQAVAQIDAAHCPEYLLRAAQAAWTQARRRGEDCGYRNAQVTVLAPTGTIGFMMDCDTTGIEPDIALVKYKLLAGGGMLKIVNNTVRQGLERLGYSPEAIRRILETIERDDTIETAEDIHPEHLPVFDCAFKPAQGRRAIGYQAHIQMMAAVQPFITGAISKTVNMPHDSTRQQIAEAYMTGWRLGLKALAIYRDGSKRSQPLSTKKAAPRSQKPAKTESTDPLERRPQRIRLDPTRHSITHKFDVAGHEGYLTVGLYKDGQPGELFITMAKEGSTVGGLMDAFGTCISMALQYGVPLSTLVEKFSHSRFEPAGMTGNLDIPFAKSIIDYIARWLGMTFLPGYREMFAPKRPAKSSPAEATAAGSNGSGKDGNKDGGGNGEPKAPPAVLTPALPTAALPDLERRAGLERFPERIDGIINRIHKAEPAVSGEKAQQMAAFNSQFSHFQSDAPVCDNCGSITVRNGNCYRCHNCGASHGCS
ncbi:MAG: vitamin B12-dependent ribonucleotide reductase [Sedimentisphaerales bacterium]|nr:vitamin B12-dependent ribonucleotide reductase [Sedimentisphaerales bacterium]